MQKYTVEADAGSMALGKGSFIATYSNSMGDGRFNVLVFDNESEFDSHEKEKPYRRYKFLSSVEGDFDLYNYDCFGGPVKPYVIASFSGRYGIYRAEHKNEMVLVHWDESSVSGEKELFLKNYAAGIIDTVEDWLDEKGVRIPNEERDKEDPENAANIYGEDYDSLEYGIMNVLEELTESAGYSGSVITDRFE